MAFAPNALQEKLLGESQESSLRCYLDNPFASLSPSLLMTAFIGNGNDGDNRQGAEQMR